MIAFSRFIICFFWILYAGIFNSLLAHPLSSSISSVPVIIITPKKVPSSPFTQILSPSNTPIPSIVERLGMLPTLEITNSGGEGNPTTFSFPGAMSHQTTVIWEDIVLNDPASPKGTYDFSQDVLNESTTIEIMSHPNFAYTAGGIGGTIRMVDTSTLLCSSSSPVCTTSTVEGGSFGSKRASIHHFQKLTKGNLSLSAGHYDTDGAPVKDTAQSNASRRNRMPFNTDALEAKGKIHLGEHSSLSFFVKEQEGKNSSFFLPSIQKTQEHAKGLSLKTSSPSHQTHHKISLLSYEIDRRLYENAVKSSTYIGSRNETLYALETSFSPNISLKTGLSLQQEHYYSFLVERLRNISSIYFLPSFKVSPTWTFQTGGRLEKSSTDSSLQKGFQIDFLHDSYTTEGGFSITRGELRPTLYELNVNDTYALGNSFLKNEKSLNFQATYGRKDLLKNTKGSLALFYRRMQDPIVAFSQQNRFFYQNGPNYYTYGITPRLISQISSSFAMETQATYALSELPASPLAPLLQTPKWKGLATFIYKGFPSFFSTSQKPELSLSFQYVGRKPDVLPSGSGRITLPEYWILNGNFVFWMNAQAKAYLRGENLLNASYRVRSDIKGTPLNLLLGIQFNF